MSTVLQTLKVALGDRSYPIIIGRNLLENLNTVIARSASDEAIHPTVPTAPAQAGLLRSARNDGLDIKDKAVFILADKAVEKSSDILSQTLQQAGVRTVRTLSIPGGERAKSFDQLEKVLAWLLDHKVDRHSILFAVGGGVIGDLAGFAASIILRGIPFIQVPTTLLSQIDSSVGGKTGINMPQGKNMVGAFHQPIAVLTDIGTLKTLPMRELRAGYAEGVKHAALGDAEFFHWLETNGEKVLALQPDALAYFIEKNCRIKAAIVAADETEQGRRALLNLGHTFGHALEAAAGFDGRLLHGEAVAIGMVLAFQLSEKLGLCPAADTARVINHLETCGLPTAIRAITPRLAATTDQLLDYMLADKKAASGRAVFILTRGIGRAFIDKTVEMSAVRQIVEQSL